MQVEDHNFTIGAPAGSRQEGVHPMQPRIGGQKGLRNGPLATDLSRWLVEERPVETERLYPSFQERVGRSDVN